MSVIRIGRTSKGGDVNVATLRGEVELASESYDKYDVPIEREWSPATSMGST